MFFSKINGKNHIVEKNGIPLFIVDYFDSISNPFAVTSLDGKILWSNQKLKEISKKLDYGTHIGAIFNELSKSFFENLKNGDSKIDISYEEKKYEVEAKYCNVMNDERVIFLSFNDVTALYQLLKENEDNKNVIGFIYIDNYDDATENLEDSKASVLLAMLDRRLNRYVSYNSGIVKKLEKDKYFFVTTKKDIEDIIEDKFSILDQTKEILLDNNIPLTLSIGIGYDFKNIEINHENARIAMDLALGRGGDQAVVKKGNETFFFGGKSASTSSNDRVRSRVKANSLKEILNTKDKVLIMGHKNGDFDSFGASIGMYLMAKSQGKDCHIVINSLTSAVEETMNKYIELNLYDGDMFIKGQEALSFADENTLLIIVDHNVSNISDEPALLQNGLDLVVFDHHRISPSSFQDAVLSYIDPSASSTCELVTEIMTYFDERIKLKQQDADSMLAGIIIDTMHFNYQTSSKTFDAAAFLKKRGADSDRIRKFLRIDKEMEEEKIKAIESAEFYRDDFAISVSRNDSHIDDIVLRAEIANELINIKGVKASISLCYDGNIWQVSCRSIDEINSQVLMEKIGGGGHRCSAGAIIKEQSEEEAKNIIKKAIDEFLLDTEN